MGIDGKGVKRPWGFRLAGNGETRESRKGDIELGAEHRFGAEPPVSPTFSSAIYMPGPIW